MKTTERPNHYVGKKARAIENEAIERVRTLAAQAVTCLPGDLFRRALPGRRLHELHKPKVRELVRRKDEQVSPGEYDAFIDNVHEALDKKGAFWHSGAMSVVVLKVRKVEGGKGTCWRCCGLLEEAPPEAKAAFVYGSWMWCRKHFEEHIEYLQITTASDLPRPDEGCRACDGPLKVRCSKCRGRAFGSGSSI